MEGAQPKRKLAKDLENELGEDYYMDMRQHWDLQEDEDKHDVIPEIYLGKNVADFIDPDIMKVGKKSNRPLTDSSFGRNILSSGVYFVESQTVVTYTSYILAYCSARKDGRDKIVL